MALYKSVYYYFIIIIIIINSVYNIYKSSSHVVTSHHSLIPYSLISLSHLHHRRIAAAPPLTPVAHDWLPGLGSAN